MSRTRFNRHLLSVAGPRRRGVMPGSLQLGNRRGIRRQAERSYGDLDSESASPCVLVAEDDDEMRRILRESLEEAGYRVIEVANGSELRRRLIKPSSPGFDCIPDVVVSDIRLPGFTGIEVLEQLRRSDWALPVILITAFGDDAVHQEARRLGAALLLDKPFDVEDLVHAVFLLAPL